MKLSYDECFELTKDQPVGTTLLFSADGDDDSACSFTKTEEDTWATFGKYSDPNVRERDESVASYLYVEQEGKVVWWFY